MPQISALFDQLFGSPSQERLPLVPEDWSDLRHASIELVRRGAARAVGLTILVVALGLALSLATFSPKDSGFDLAAPAAENNWLGVLGSYWGGMLWSWLGVLPMLALIPPLIWGLWICDGRMDMALARRIPAWAASLACATFALTALNGSIGSTLAGGWGGLSGLVLHHSITSALEGMGLEFLVSLLIFAAAAGSIFLYLYSGALNPLQASLPQLAMPQGMNLPALPKMSLGGFWPFRRREALGEDADDSMREDPEFVLDEGDEAAPEPVPAPRASKRVEPKIPSIPGDAAAEAEAATRIVRTEKPKPGKRIEKEAQPVLELDEETEYELPPLTLLARPKDGQKITRDSDEVLEENARRLEAVLSDFGVRGRISQVRPGPVVTLYELEPAAGIRSSRVISLADDIARSMSAVSARVAAVPGRNVIGIELPNQKRETVFLRDLLSGSEYENTGTSLSLALGKNIGGESVVADLARMPHLLIAGTTGSGKSVAINTMILSLLYKLPPNICKLIMIDPKMLELSVYDGIPHLLTPVVTDPKKAVVALKWTVREMEDRYRRMSKLGVRNISGYNERIARAAEKGETLKRQVQTGFDAGTGQPIFEEENISLEPMPFIVVIVDEMADLMLVAGKDIEGAVQRLAQMARAAGIHIIMATQRPSVDVITGTIKANFPTRISFQVTSKIDSRTILGEQGAEQLLGQGDMLYMEGGGRIRRVHGPFVSDGEVEEIVKFLKAQGEPEYLDDITVEPEAPEDGEGGGTDGEEGEGGDDLYDKAVAIVARDRKASTSYIQRRLQIGYNRAARIIEKMEEQGVVSSPNHSGKREVLVGEH
jgi:DNA segregation ATPase FtsK/SpoIIIE, S-DNA-T family